MTRPKSSTSPDSSKKSGISTSKKDRDKRFGNPREDPRGTGGKANREDIRKEARRVNVPRQSRRPVERSK
jgi:hypothetical protein